jgi:hypothetical protein
MPQSAVMIDLREAEVLERKMANARESIVNAGCAGTNIFEKRSQLVFAHVINITGLSVQTR